MEQTEGVTTQDLLAMIGMKEVEINVLRGKLADAEIKLEFQAKMQAAAVPVKEKQ